MLFWVMAPVSRWTEPCRVTQQVRMKQYKVCPAVQSALTRLPVLLIPMCTQKSRPGLLMCLQSVTHSQKHRLVMMVDFIPTFYD